MPAGLSAVLPRKEKDFAMMGGSNKNDGGLDLQGKVKRAKHTLSWGKPSRGSPVCVCACRGTSLAAADKLAPLWDRDGLGKGGSVSTGVRRLVGWRGDPVSAPADTPLPASPGGSCWWPPLPSSPLPALPASPSTPRQALQEPLRAVAADTADESVLLKRLEK